MDTNASMREVRTASKYHTEQDLHCKLTKLLTDWHHYKSLQTSTCIQNIIKDKSIFRKNLAERSCITQKFLVCLSVRIASFRTPNFIDINFLQSVSQLKGRHRLKSVKVYGKNVPETHLFLGRGLDPKTIKEGIDVYFDCHVKANPPPTSTVFFHEGVEVTKKSFPRAILSGLSLALQRVNASMAGEYSCKSTNAKGSSTSEVVNLEVMYKPVCRTRNLKVPVSLGRNVTVNCTVDAFPPPSRFAWSLNDTKGLVSLPQTQFESRGDTSQLHYTMPENVQEVRLFCWANNSLGVQKEPCTIRVFTPGKPKQVQGCTMEQRKQSLVVSCQPGVEGAVDQTYEAQLRLSDSGDVIANVTSKVPSFSFDTLEKGLEYVVYVFTLNIRYRSPPVVLEVSSLKVAENRMNTGGPEGSEGASPLLALFIGVVAAFLLTLAVILAATKFRCSAAAAAGAAKASRGGEASGEAGGSIVGLEDNCDSDDDDDDEVGKDETSFRGDPKDGQTHTVQVESQPGSHSKESLGASSQDQLLQSTSSSLGIQPKDPLLSREALRQADDATVYKKVSFEEESPQTPGPWSWSRRPGVPAVSPVCGMIRGLQPGPSTTPQEVQHHRQRQGLLVTLDGWPP
ncbi:uncharacterized protein LOC143037762 [Oratosquilla oratoria]|uniref:uncharacterized protein LOC143037762 n=1 Tax=Oratosquilla oratoria TaxID=337810 RepID=UPI003F7697F3